MLDPAVERARSAGGPIDQASYACQCGYLFLAPVSTTVVCPHCRSPQAW
jgi:predicted Zn-ribbon and HTH transcriptional regulator